MTSGRGGGSKKEIRVDAGNTFRGVGTSMLPFVLPGSRLHLEHKGREGFSVREGDVICFIGGGGKMVAHRVVGVDREGESIRYAVAGDTYGEPEIVRSEEISSVVTRVENNLFSYETRGRIGKVLARHSVGRTAPFRGTLAAARVAVRVYRLASMLGVGGAIKRLVVGPDHSGS